MSARRSLAVVAAASLLGGCKLEDDELGRAVLQASPAIVLVGALVLWGYHRAYKQLDQQISYDPRPTLLMAGTLAVAGAYSAVRVRVEDLVLIAAWLAGASYLSLLLVTARVLLRVSPRHAFSHALLVPSALLFAPALVMAAKLTSDWAHVAEAIWIVPGMYGFVTAVIAAGLAVEVWVRVRRSKFTS